MTQFKRILTSVTAGIIVISIPLSILCANEIVDFMKEKCSVQEAVAALHKGHCVHRAGQHRKYCVKKEIFEGEEKVFVGNTWGDGKFSEGILLHTDDVMTNDWIIEPLLEKMQIEEKK